MQSANQIVASLAKRHAWGLIVGFAALLAVDVLQLWTPRLIKSAVDQLTLGQATQSSLAWLAAAVLGLAAAISLLRLLWRPLLFGFARRVETAIRQRIFEHVQQMHLGYLDDQPPGEIMARATNDLNNIRMSLGMGLVAAVDGAIMGAAAIGFMLYLSPTLTILALIPMPLIAIAGRMVGRQMHGGFMAVQESFARMTEQTREALSAIGLVKAFALARREEQRMAQAGREYFAQNMRLARLMAVLFPLSSFFTSLSLAVVIGAGGPLAVFGQITAGDFVAFTAYLGLLTWPMMALGWVISLMQRGRASMQRVSEIITARPAVSDPAQPEALDPATPLDLEIRDLSFRYPGAANPALDRASLFVEAGRATALVGPVGCGKSTVLRLLTRLYDPPPGAALIQGRDVRALAQDELRSRVSLSPQEAFVFSTSVRENLALGRPQASDDELWAALRAADLAEDIRALPQGLESELGERGHTLSGGQRQRLALARILLIDPPALLLDDPLSAVDTATERRILANLAELRRGKTTLLVSHRLASVAFAARIFVMDHGRVVESGDHATLVAAGGLYQSLFAEQALLAELEG
ncbi:ABC transporter related protein [Desulfarculus baarsii DSM 2075]|uniref:ABC transporter related protein n=1 Tax=Desulfarculus baarsii (strain ATCC 33931 / DSM 2075 / LMG 7858 / VKM B-1802 / 2st14) TaxID=644282 RepID=E1QGV7_DESB2|nr:ABC transporter ATP-binding protein [Desulfarculus baarsii]ADK84800.1 ABC transporter related protein [Desulfarculus baarsii DSM 2075]